MRYLIILCTALFLAACSIPTFIAPDEVSFSHSTKGHPIIPDSSTVMVVGIQQSNSIVLQVEDVLLAQRVRLIADPEVQLQVPVMQTQRSIRDTLINETVMEPRVRALYPSQAADYLLRYRYIGSNLPFPPSMRA
ncbi:MAG: hypothetical protein D6772_13820 [Bacteroidetes bacterium]|nr:MAG: hypothetical protein D6772_13820 [Bacteroidota bacterium]